MMAQETSKPVRVSATLRRLASYFRPYWPVLLLVALTIVGGTYTQVRAPELTGQAVDCFLTPATSGGQQGPGLLVRPPAPGEQHRGVPGRAGAAGAGGGGPLRRRGPGRGAAVLPHDLGRAARPAIAAPAALPPPAPPLPGLLLPQRGRGPDEPGHQRHRHPPAGGQLHPGQRHRGGPPDRLDPRRHAGLERPLRPGQHGRPAGDGRGHPVALRPGAGGPSARPGWPSARSTPICRRRSPGCARCRPSGGRRPTSRPSGTPTPPTGTPTSAPSPSPRPSAPPWRPSATWPSGWSPWWAGWPSSRAASSSAPPSPWA